MNSVIHIFGKEIPIYGICFWIAIICCVLLALLLCKKRGMERYDLIFSAVFTLVGAVIGAKLLFLIISLPDIIVLFQHYSAKAVLEAIIKGGFVFYGGLGGGALGLWIYAKRFRMSAVDFFDVYALVLPFGHAIGRVGCFFGGCCYGIEYDGPLSCTYESTLGRTPLGVPLFPVQLLEAFCLLLVFAVSLLLYFKNPKERLQPCLVYLTAYPVIRFCLEFLRGDRERGILLGISTSQWVSMGIFAVAIGLWILRARKKGCRNE